MPTTPHIRARLFAATALLVILSGCVREQVDGDTHVFTIKWWMLLVGAALPLGYVTRALVRTPWKVWEGGQWKPPFRWREWDVRQLAYLTGLLIVPAFVLPTLWNRLEVDKSHFEYTRGFPPDQGSVRFTELTRIETRPEAARNGGLVKLPKDKEREKGPYLRLVFRGGSTRDLSRDYTLRAGRDQLLEAARAAGVSVGTFRPGFAAGPERARDQGPVMGPPVRAPRAAPSPDGIRAEPPEWVRQMRKERERSREEHKRRREEALRRNRPQGGAP